MGYHAQFAYPEAHSDELPQPPSSSSSRGQQGSVLREDWVEWHSVDLMNMWRSLVTYLEDSCLNRDIILPYSDYHDFCEYCYENSSKMRSKNAT